jgi:hypothetical protein
MPRIILSIFIIIGIVAWVVHLQLRQQKELELTSSKMKVLHKSYVSADVLAQGVDALVIKQGKISVLKDAIHQQIVGMDGFINAIIITLLAGGHALVE